ncbi:unnamed protein product [Penicillium salamii]|uniref:Uncharacterized protein n=1 Tax=Penicillium salamii TaxID=1612424 RepID=A0A9W4NMH6_9EURO|nr:unnamed protein product [Penicillium salamii]CAG8383860.1 unnamed protein product [Penicillium salamii]CAG8384687.1 unnamed protein product [Penicillium salamii]CAG8385503.1 unnamed protein product [Penicillium salamii]
MPSIPTESKETPRNRKGFNARCLDTWLVETIAVLFSVACFLAICGILIAYNGKPRPDLRYGMSLNAIISVLATGCKSSLLFTIGEALGQLKWVWFRGKARPLVQLQTFDSASRGPFGSIVLLFQRGHWVASFGAGIVIVFLSFDPFMQQIVGYPIQQAAMGDGTGVATTKRLKHFTPIQDDMQWASAYSSGVWSDDNLFHPNCPTGNCTWSPFKSLSLCTKCGDITTETAFSCHRKHNETYSDNKREHFNATCSVKIPHGDSTVMDSQFFISKDSPRVKFGQNITWHVHSACDETDLGVVSDKRVDNLTFAGVTNPLMVYAYAQVGYDIHSVNASDPISGFRLRNVTECSLAICLSDWNVSVSDGNPTIKTSNVDYGVMFWRNFTVPKWEPPWLKALCWRPASSPADILMESPFYGNGSWNLPALSPVEFAFCGVNTIQVMQKKLLAGSAPISDQWMMGMEGHWMPPESDPSTKRIASIGLDKVMSGVADSLNKMTLQGSGENVHGTAYTATVYVEVHWPWLVLPGLLVLSGIIFFVLAVFAQNDALLWKSSVFAFLFHGVGDVETDCTTVSEMEREASGMSVQLRLSEAKGKLKLE